MNTFFGEIKNNRIHQEELTRAIEYLDKSKVIQITENFINTNPDDVTKEVFKSAMKDGVGLITKKFEVGEYNIKDIIIIRNILDEVLGLISHSIQEPDHLNN